MSPTRFIASFLGLISATAADGTVVTMRIADAAPDPGDADIWLYQVEMQDPDSFDWYPICPVDGLGRSSAIAVAGHWDETGAHVTKSDLFTSGCTVGVIYKCASWGYKPWQTVMAFEHNRWREISLAGHHQACTRMARADYCGSGVSHTADGTAIDVHDNLGLNVDDPDGQYMLDGGWDEDGAVCVTWNRRRNDVNRASHITDTCVQDDVWEIPDCAAKGLEDVFVNFPKAMLANQTESDPNPVSAQEISASCRRLTGAGRPLPGFGGSHQRLLGVGGRRVFEYRRHQRARLLATQPGCSHAEHQPDRRFLHPSAGVQVGVAGS
jgi:hypothetical protein